MFPGLWGSQGVLWCGGWGCASAPLWVSQKGQELGRGGEVAEGRLRLCGAGPCRPSLLQAEAVLPGLGCSDCPLATPAFLCPWPDLGQVTAASEAHLCRAAGHPRGDRHGGSSSLGCGP